MLQPGIRIRLGSYLGTVRFVGEVRGTRGTWLGVEWDDPSRGKHDGTKDGVRYFTCVIPNTGSFVRPTAPGISFGQSFLAALSAKYVEENHGPNETVILGSSNGSIEVEIVNMDLIRANLARLEALCEVSLEDVSSADPPGQIRLKNLGIRGLDLSDSLLSSWDTVAAITIELPELERLSLNRTRLLPAANLSYFASAFMKLAELQISSTLIKWPEFLTLLDHMSSVTYVEMGLNRLTELPTPKGASEHSYRIKVLNLDSNQLHDWVDLCNALKHFPSLRRLLLTDNCFERIPVYSKNQTHPALTVEQLLLTGNRISAWMDIDNLIAWAPNLRKLRLRGNPLYEDPTDGKYYRQFLVAKIPTLVELDGTAVASKERRDCEIFYISHISRVGPSTEEEKRRQHPRWKELCDKWGAPEEAVKVQNDLSTLGSQLINLNIHRCSSPPTAPYPAMELSMSLKVLKTMTLKALRLKIAKSFQLSRRPGGRAVRLWLHMVDGNLAELDSSQDGTNLMWWGLEDGTDVYMYCGD